MIWLINDHNSCADGNMVLPKMDIHGVADDIIIRISIIWMENSMENDGD